MEDKCQLYTALKQESRFHSDDYFLYRADGSCFPAEIWSHPLIINGRVEGAVVTFLDISKRREAEREVRESATRLSLATRGSGVGIWDLDLIKNVLVWDDQMYRLYGITKEKFGGAYESWIKGLHPDDVAGENKKVEEAINGTKDFDTEFRVVWPDESVHNIRGLAIVISNDSGKPIRMIGTNWDITGQKKIEEDLMKAMAEADLANKAKSEFLLNISHEFRTPLNAVLGFADMLESAEGKNRKEYADSVRSGGRRLLTMVDDILDFIRLEKTGLEPELDFIDTYGFFHEFEKSFADSISEKGLKFKTIISEDLPASILIDERRLRQIITKLIDNAIKYTLQGDVGLNVYQKRSDCSEAEGKTDLIIEVSDTGKGIPEEFRKKIFEAFSQSENKTILDGIGMGLSLTQRIVSCLKGTIKVISQEGMGSKFIVTIPGIGFRNGIKAPVQSD